MVALAVLSATVVVAILGALIHRDLTRLNEQLAESGRQPDRRHLDQLRDEARRLQHHVSALDGRLGDVETAVSDLRQKNVDVAKYVGWMWPHVRQWAGQAERR